jgi:RNA polymerase sigma-70 factor (ECF subfamily)
MSVQMADAPHAGAWQAHRTGLVRFVEARVHDRATAEDIVQDVLLKAYGRAETLRDAGSVQAWLYRITRNAIVDHYRARRPTEALPDDLEAEGEAGPDARQALARCLQPMISQLPDGYRDAVVLAEIQGLTQQETAERLGISLSGAKSRVQRARGRLHEMLRACCRLEFDSRGALMDFEASGGCAPAACGAACGTAGATPTR